MDRERGRIRRQRLFDEMSAVSAGVGSDSSEAGDRKQSVIHETLIKQLEIV